MVEPVNCGAGAGELTRDGRKAIFVKIKLRFQDLNSIAFQVSIPLKETSFKVLLCSFLIKNYSFIIYASGIFFYLLTFSQMWEQSNF